MSDRLLKITRPSGEPCHGGSGAWGLPRRTKAGGWMPGRWRKVSGRLTACEVGLHLVDDNQLPRWLPEAPYTIWLAEARGDVIAQSDKYVYREARLLEALVTVDVGTAKRYQKRHRSKPLSVDAIIRFIATQPPYARIGEPIVFGVHTAEGAYAPAWPAPASYDRQRVSRTLRVSGKMLGIPKAVDEAVKQNLPGAWEMALTWGTWKGRRE